MEQPLVSVIISAYQAEKTLGYCLQSVLAQDYQNMEIIIVNNGSFDGTQAVIDDYLLKDKRISTVLLRENRLPAGGRNAGINQAMGEYIAFLDADDAWSLETKISTQAKILDTYSNIGLIFSDYVSIDEITKIRTLYTTYNRLFTRGMEFQNLDNQTDFLVLRGNISRMIYSGNFINLSTVITRKNILQEAGCFNPQLFGTEDIDLWVRLAKLSTFCYWKEATTNYYFQDTSTSRLSDRRIRELIKYHLFCLGASEYESLKDVVFKNLEYCYKMLILEYSIDWKPINALGAYIEAKKNGLNSNKLFFYAICAFLGPLPITINNRIIRPVRTRLGL